MAGTKVKKEFTEEVEAQGGDKVIFDRIVQGETVTAICEEYGIARSVFYFWCNRYPERKAAFQVARELSAHALADEALEIVDSTENAESSVQVSSARLRADYRKWLAETRNRKDYGQSKAEVHVNVGELHLEALKAKGRRADEVDQEALESAVGD